MDANKIEILKRLYYANELPVPYNLKCGVQINIYPVKVKDWELFENSMGVLTIDKNSIADVDIISMSYLDFLYKLIHEKTDGIMDMLNTVLQYSLGNHSYSITKLGERRKTFLLIKDMDAQISSREFDEISEIILSYNLTEYDNRKMSSDVQELINDYYKLMNNNKYRHASLEEQKVFVLLKSGISIQQINEMSYRIFSQVYTTALDCDLYISNKIIQGSQKYETKGEIVHPLLEKKVDILEKIFTDKDKFVNDMKSKLG
jgi:hypothetical protein